MDAPVQVTVVPARTAKGLRFEPRYVCASAGAGRTREKRAAIPTLASRRTHLHGIQLPPRLQFGDIIRCPRRTVQYESRFRALLQLAQSLFAALGQRLRA